MQLESNLILLFNTIALVVIVITNILFMFFLKIRGKLNGDDSIASQRESIERLECENNQLKSDLEDKSHMFVESEKIIAGQKASIESNLTKIDEIQSELSRSQDELKLKSQKIIDLEISVTRANAENENQKKEISDLRSKISNFQIDIDEKRNEISSLQNHLASCEKDLSVSIKENEGIGTNNEEHKKEILKLKNELSEKRELISELEKKQLSLESENVNMQKRIEQNKTDLEKIEERFKYEFQSISNKLFDKYSENFKITSKESISVLMAPLLKDIKDFNSALVAEGRSKATLEGTIKQMIESTKLVSEQSENLASALKGDIKIQGSWGEIMLEKILEECGLRKGEDYILQGKNMGLKSPDDKRILRPDVLVNLPDNKHIIIDSKISLLDYEKYCSENDELMRPKHLEKFKNSIKKHIEQLGEKRYQDIDKLTSPEFVLMFLGIEGAYSLAVHNIPALHTFAWERKVVIVNPSTLFATLNTISSVWHLELQNQNANKIAEDAGKLYDKFVGFVEDMENIKNKISGLSDAHSSAMTKLATGRGNLLKKAEDLKKLGIKTSKSLPAKLVSQSAENSTKGDNYKKDSE